MQRAKKWLLIPTACKQHGCGIAAAALHRLRRRQAQLNAAACHSADMLPHWLMNSLSSKRQNQLMALSAACLQMVTGDSLIVAKHVCKRVGIAVEHCIEGPQLALMDREQFSAAVVDGTVFARCTPHQKLQIVSQLQVRCREQPHQSHEGYWGSAGAACCMLACKEWHAVHGGCQRSVQALPISQPAVVHSKTLGRAAARKSGLAVGRFCPQQQRLALIPFMIWFGLSFVLP